MTLTYGNQTFDNMFCVTFANLRKNKCSMELNYVNKTPQPMDFLQLSHLDSWNQEDPKVQRQIFKFIFLASQLASIASRVSDFDTELHESIKFLL